MARKKRRSGWIICTLVVIVGLPASGDASADVYDRPFFEGATFDEQIPAPEQALGFEPGSRPVRHAAVLSYFRALAAASPRIELREYGRTHEGRELVYAIISSQENMARLEEIRGQIGLLADPRLPESGARAYELIENTPAVAWMGYSIHGDELSSTDAAVAVAHYLVAGTNEQAEALRRGLVVIIDPLMNPDGRERFLAQIEAARGQVANLDVQSLQHGGRWPWGRGNHYLFDMNRDWLPITQPETAGRVREALKWNPQIFVDSHEMGPLETYLFYPAREPINPQLTEALKRWWTVFGRDHAKAFDRYGWSYYTREWVDHWYPGYSDAWASFGGAVGILYEQAGVDGSAVKQLAGDVLTYREAVHHHTVSSVTNLETLLKHRQDILRAFHQERVNACDPGTKRAYDAFVLVPGRNPGRERLFLANLLAQDIELQRALEPFTADVVLHVDGRTEQGASFPAGTYLVSMVQPRGPLAAALLEFDPRMTDAFLTEERHELEQRNRTRIYDITAWSLAMANDLEAHWVKGAGAFKGETVEHPPEKEGKVAAGPAAYGYVVDGRDDDACRALVELFAAGAKVRVAERDFTVRGVRLSRGSLLVRRHENPGELGELAAKVAAATGVELVNVESALGEAGDPDLGGEHFWLLAEPKVAVLATPPVSPTSYGAIWHLLDHRLGLRMSSLDTERLAGLDLRKYNVLVLPDSDIEAMRRALGDDAAARLRTWVETGGTLIAVGGSAAMLADESIGLSGVRRRRDVLDKLAVYAEAVAHERSALKTEVEPAKVWQYQPSTLPSTSEAGAKPDTDALKRRDEWERRFAPRGTILQTGLDGEHWLTFGARGTLPVLVWGSHVLLSAPPARTPVRLASAAELRLSGLLWPEAAERLADSAWATVERLGHGQVILFQSDPTFRGFFHGGQRLFVNAVLLGPGAGTTQPQPW